MKFFTKVFLPLSFLLFPFIGFSNYLDDSVKTFLLRKINDFELDTVKNLDFSLNNFQNYTSRFAIGNIGRSVSLLEFKNNSQFGFNYFRNNQSIYFLDINKLKMYNTKTPYADVFYLAGSKKEQYFNSLFTVNINKNLNFGFVLNRVRSEGFYLRQKTNNSFVGLTANYITDKKNYFLTIATAFNRSKNEENGGILDSSFTKDENIDKKLYSIYLRDARRLVENKFIDLNQYFALNTSDSATVKRRKYIHNSGINVGTRYEDYGISYSDNNPQSGYYSKINFDSTQTVDSTFIYKLSNRLDYKDFILINNESGNTIIYSAGIAHQFFGIKQRYIDTSFNNISFNFSLKNSILKSSLNNELRLSYFLSGYNAGNYSAFLNSSNYFFENKIFVHLGFEYAINKPDFIFNRYVSNNFDWENNFKNIGKLNTHLDIAIKKVDLNFGIDYTNIENLTYFDNYSIPRQFNQNLSITKYYLKKNFQLRHWHLDNRLIYQIVPESTVVRLPKFAIENSIYFETKLFKSNLDLLIGACLNYFSSYYGDAYMPATGQFYLQNEKKIGNYPFVDFFINCKIKVVRVFFKVDHLNNGLSGNNYYVAPNYPINGRAFKIGISWRFFD